MLQTLARSSGDCYSGLRKKAVEAGSGHLLLPRMWGRHCSLPLCEAVKAGWPQNSASSHQMRSGKDFFFSLLGLILESPEQVYTSSVCLVVGAKCDLVRKSHNAVKASCRLLRKHFTGSKLFINLQRVTGELLKDHVSFLGCPFQTFPESCLSPFLS